MHCAANSSSMMMHVELASLLVARSYEEHIGMSLAVTKVHMPSTLHTHDVSACHKLASAHKTALRVAFSTQRNGQTPYPMDLIPLIPLHYHGVFSPH